MPALLSRDDVVKVVQALPAEASLDDVIERLLLLRKIDVGLSQEGQGLTQAEARAEFAKSRGERSWSDG